MDNLKTNPFRAEVESALLGLGLDLAQARQIVPNGALYNFNYNEVPVYLCIPTELPSPYSNIARIDAEVAELDEVEAGQLIVAIASYLQIEDCTPVRVTAKRSKGRQIKILIEFVSDLKLLETGALSAMLLHCMELADQMRSDLVAAVGTEAA